jgi:hypothetical protein
VSDPLTTDELFATYVARFGEERVHRAGIPHFAGRPGHHYFVGRRPTNVELARMSHHSGPAEVSLIRINRTFIVNVGNRGIPNAALFMPERVDGVESFEWIAHTHPLEMENAYHSVAHGGTREDREALERVHRRWGQIESTVVVCRAGRLVRAVPFRPDPPERPDIHVVEPGGGP